MQNNNAVHPNLTKTPVFFLKCLKRTKTRGYFNFSGDHITILCNAYLYFFRSILQLYLFQQDTYSVSEIIYPAIRFVSLRFHPGVV